MFRCFPSLAFALIIFAAVSGRAAEVDFVGDIEPIFRARCYTCHAAEAQEGELRLDAAWAVLRGGISGPAVVPGRPESSPLFQRVAGQGDAERMPADDEPLAADEIERIRQWIEQGAPWPSAASAPVESVEPHWAYVAPRRPALPADVESAWAVNAVDGFIREKQRAADLDPAPPASRETLVRRLFLDLLGVPPRVPDVDDFLADRRPDAYERLVDRLLASPQYGVRWARPWLDAARYADSNGYQADQYRDVWPYRDWVVAAMNSDMPFDEFTIEQLAGDLLPAATVDQQIATGFHRLTTCNVEAGVDPEENRVNQIIDRVNTTGTVWLGTTVACAQCHNHKYDPITQRDYYRLFAYFNNTPLEVEGDGVTYNFVGPKMTLSLGDLQREQRQQLQDELAKLESQRGERAEKLLSQLAAWERAATATEQPPAELAELIAVPVSERQPEDQRQIETYYLGLDSQLKRLDEQIAGVKDGLSELQPPTTLVMVEQEPRVTRVFRRGDFLQPGSDVKPQPPAWIGAVGEDLPGDRFGLARWVVDAGNPLTARVAVNRWWAEFFGRGIVETLEDFGTQSSPPSHPELLDWLAVELIDSGWSMKHVHKLIVMSATYRQSSQLSDRVAKQDPYNVYYARGSRYRLPAETIRDNALAISGLLCRDLGGPPVFPPQPDNIWRHVGRNAPRYATSTGGDRYRRGLYVVWRRSAPYPSFTNFDAPDRSDCVVQRPRTNTPLQALTLLNDPAYVEISLALAERLLRDRPAATVDERVRYVWRLCVAREPRPQELEHVVSVFQEERARLEDNLKEAQQLVGAWGQAYDARDVAAWFYVANILLNLDETISRS